MTAEDRVLDICCGTGAQVIRYGMNGIKAVGIDNDPNMLKAASKNKSKRQLKNIAAESNTEEKTIHRIRARAIKDFYLIKKELPTQVQNYLRVWSVKHGKELVEISPSNDLKEKLKQHKNDLADAAKEVLKILNMFEGRTDLDENTEIGEVILIENDTETAGILEKQIVVGLFTHMKNEIAELVPLSCWQDLTPNYISFELRKKISMKAARRDFIGECEVCKVWMRK